MHALKAWGFGYLTRVSISTALYLMGSRMNTFFILKRYVLSSIHHLVETWQPPQSSRLLIYMDNDNTVAIFNTLRCLPKYNNILISAADVLIKEKLDLCVLHIPGELNYVTNTIS